MNYFRVTTLHLLVACAGLLLATALGTSVFAAVSERRSSHLSTRIQVLEAQSAATPLIDSKHISAGFVDSLSSKVSNDEVMRTAQRAAEHHDVQLTSFQSEEHVAATDTLGRLDLAVSFRGAYPSVVAVLADILDRFPGATLKQLTLVRPTSLDNVSSTSASITTAPGPSLADRVCDARVTFSFWSRPLQPAVTPVH